MITKAVIPVAGLGTRFLPATKGIAKEMFPLIDKPCLQYLVEEAVASGIKEIIFVVSPEKEAAIRAHFTPNPELNARLQAKNQQTELQSLQAIEQAASYHFVIQDKALGDGHAILCAQHLLENEDFAVLFGDDIHDSTPPALAQLIESYQKHQAPIIAIEKINLDDCHKYGIIEPHPATNINEPETAIKSLVEKPDRHNAPSDLAISGKYIITARLFQTLKEASAGPDGELRIIDALKQFVQTNPLYGRQIQGRRFDTGDKAGYIKAVIHFALKNKNIEGQIKKFLQDIDLS